MALCFIIVGANLATQSDIGLPTTRDSVKSTTSNRSWLAPGDAARTLLARLLYSEEDLRFLDARAAFLGTLVSTALATKRPSGQ